MSLAITTKKEHSTTKVLTSNASNTSPTASSKSTAANSSKSFKTSSQAAPFTSSTHRPNLIPSTTAATTSAVAPKSTLMIKNIENSSSNHTDWDENEEEEKEICNVLQRRDSLPTEDGTQTTTAAASSSSSSSSLPIIQQSNNKLNTIQESNNEHQPISADSQQQPELLSTTLIACDVNLEDPSTSTINDLTEQQNQDHEQLAAATQLSCTIDNLDSSSSTLGNISSFDTTSNTTAIAAASTTTESTTSTTTSIGAAAAASESKFSTSPSDSPPHKSSTSNRTSRLPKTSSFSKISNSFQNTLSSTASGTGSGSGNGSGGGGGSSAASFRGEEDTISKSSDTSGDLVRTNTSQDLCAFDKPKNTSRLSERAKKKSWYNVLYPNYKSRAQDFKKLFKEVPNDERLIVDYSCALQRDILVQGRLYVSQNYVCFHANIFRWETYLSIKWKDVTSITKEKTALVIPNAISICTAKEKYFFATFATRDKAFLMLFRVWQNTLMNKQMLPQEMWQWVHNCYGDELGLTTDDEDYIDPKSSAAAAESELDLDFVSALEDTSSLLSFEGTSARASVGDASDYATANSNSNQSINNPNSNSSNTNNNNSGTIVGGNSSASGGIVGIVPTKTKSKSYFFNSHKSSHFNSSTTASASGSDNKASDNNSGADTAKNSRKNNTMKANAKELTLKSAKPEESVTASQTAATAAANDSGGGSGNGGGASSGNGGASAAASSAVTSGASANKENSSKNVSGHGDGSKRTKVSKNSRIRDDSLSKNLANMPTDISDSSDSDESEIPFVVTTDCSSTHEGRQLVHTILPINIDTLFNLLFSKSKFLLDFHAMRKTTDMSFGDWVTSDEGKQTRKVNITVQLQASVGPKNSKVTEFQEMRDCSKPGERYSIDINSVNAGIPYADSFSVLLHYCLVRTIDDHTMLSVHAQIKYKKSIWGVVKGFIEKNTWAGLEDFYTALLHALQSETCIPPAKGKGRRPRRGTASQIRPLEETPNAQSKSEPTENTLATHTHHMPHLPLAQHHQHAMHGVSGVDSSSSKYKWLSLFVLILLCFLIVLNVILLLKLWKLEERIEDDLTSRARMPNLASLKELPHSHQDWIELLRQQEILHETELRKWHKVLQTAIELLKKTENTLAALMFR